MKKIYIFLLGFIFLAGSLFAQTKTVTFVGQNASTKQYIKLSKVVITNRTKNWTETIVYPDTVLILKTTGIADKTINGFALGQNRPNPFQGSTDVTLEVSKSGKITMELFDILGRNLESLSLDYVQPGQHNFRIQVAHAGIYFLTAIQNGHKTSVKMIAQADATGNHIDYVGMGSSFNNNSKGEISKPYANGDELSFQGIANVEGKTIASKTIISSVINSETITLPFEVGSDEFICGISTVTDIDGNIYNTVLLGSQCWMSENMRTTRFADSSAIELTTEMSKTVPYRYAPNTEEENIAKVGYLYNWSAVMHGAKASNEIPSGVQGLCPAGWHIPSDAEFLKTVDYLASNDEYLCGQKESEHGPYIAAALCSNEFWKEWATECSPGHGIASQSNNASGFNFMPSGCFYNNIQGFSTAGYLWTTTDAPASWQEDAYNIFFDFGLAFVQNSTAWVDAGYSVRCLKD